MRSRLWTPRRNAPVRRRLRARVVVAHGAFRARPPISILWCGRPNYRCSNEPNLSLHTPPLRAETHDCSTHRFCKRRAPQTITAPKIQHEAAVAALAARAARSSRPTALALHRTPAQTRSFLAKTRARGRTRRDACLVQIDSDGSRQQIECTDGSAEYLRDRNDGAAGSLRDRAYASTRRNLRRIFLPVAVNEEYVSYTRWRCVQRLLSATVNVFGVQAMVMAVGLRDARAVAAGGAVVGAAAAVDWVLKDALGKVTRLGWAARMGREFDGDAKRWRFRSSLLYATGNGLQIATFAFPLLFLLLATVANCLKQVSMLTSTATRSAIYRSFAATETTNNLGDVTAKGEAQIAVVDLVGLLIGLVASKKLGVASTQANPRMLLAIYGSLYLCWRSGPCTARSLVWSSGS